MEDKLAPDYQNDDYNEDDYNSPEQQPNEIPPTSDIDTNSIGSPAYFEKDHYSVEVKPGENIKLNSFVKNLSKHNVIMWYNASQLMVQSNHVLRDKDRISVEESNLVIKNIQLSDDSEYVCKLLPEKVQMNVSLHVLSPPRNIRIIHNDVNVSTNTLHLKNGERLQLHCSAEKGRPTPSITWSKDVSLVFIEL